MCTIATAGPCTCEIAHKTIVRPARNRADAVVARELAGVGVGRGNKNPSRYNGNGLRLDNPAVIGQGPSSLAKSRGMDLSPM